MYSECVNGLLERLQSDAQINIHDPKAQIRPSKISIGIIPAGNYCLYRLAFIRQSMYIFAFISYSLYRLTDVRLQT